MQTALVYPAVVFDASVGVAFWRWNSTSLVVLFRHISSEALVDEADEDETRDHEFTTMSKAGQRWKTSHICLTVF